MTESSLVELDSPLFFDQAVWCEDGPQFTPGFLKRLHLTEGTSFFRTAPFEVHFLHNLRGRRAPPEKICAFVSDNKSSAKQTENLHLIAANGPLPLPAGKKARSLSSKQIGEINAAIEATQRWSLNRGIRVQSQLPHSIYASLTIDVMLDAALASARGDSRAKDQQVVRAQVLVVDPTQIRNPIITHPPLYISPRTPVRVVSSNVVGQWKFAGDFILLGSAVNSLKFVDLRAAAEATCVHRLVYESKRKVALSSMFASLPGKDGNGGSAKKELGKSSAGKESSGSAPWVVDWKCGLPFSPNCFPRRHWIAVRQWARSELSKPRKSVKSAVPVSVPLRGIDVEHFEQQFFAASEDNLQMLLSRWSGAVDPRDQNDSDLEPEPEEESVEQDAEVVEQKTPKRAKLAATELTKKDAAKVAQPEEIPSEKEIRARFADIRAEAAEQREDWAKWSLRAQRQLRDRNAFHGPLTLFETMDRSTLSKMFSSQPVSALSRSNGTSSSPSNAAAAASTPKASKEKTERMGQWVLSDFLRVAPSTGAATAQPASIDMKKLPPHSLALPQTMLLPFFVRHSSPQMVADLVRTVSSAPTFDIEEALNRHRALEYRCLSESAEKKRELRRSGQPISKSAVSPTTLVAGAIPPDLFPQRIQWTAEGTLVSRERADGASPQQRRASART